jgi:hypothetical protein
MEFINPYEQFKQHVDEANQLRTNLASAIEGGDKKNIKAAKKALKSFGRGKLAGVDKFQKVNDLLSDFKGAVGEEEYNYFDNLSFGGNDIDIVISLESDNHVSRDGNEDGSTNFTYTLGAARDFKTGKVSSTFINGIKDNKFRVILYDQDLSTLGNELGDVKFGVERAETVRSEQGKGKINTATARFSVDYEYYVRGENEKPNPHNKKY